MANVIILTFSKLKTTKQDKKMPSVLKNYAYFTDLRDGSLAVGGGGGPLLSNSSK